MVSIALSLTASDLQMYQYRPSFFQVSEFLGAHHWLHAIAQEVSEWPINRAVSGLVPILDC